MSICNNYKVFKQVYNISDDYLLNILESNFKTYLDWGFLNVGGWFNVIGSGLPVQGGSGRNKLLRVDDPSFKKGAVWQSQRKDWVWESGFIYKNQSPIPISGLYVDNTYIANTGNNFIVNYPEGKIILNNPPISPLASVYINYSYKYIQTYKAYNNPWFNIVQYSSFDTANKDIKRKDDGDWNIGSEHRIQLPAIVIEAITRGRNRPFEIGSKSLVIEQDVGFYILAENRNDRNRIIDILRLQQDDVIMLYDTNKLAKDEKYPLDHNGNLRANPLMYPLIVDQYPWRKCWIKNINIFEMDSIHPNMHRALVRATMEIISE